MQIKEIVSLYLNNGIYLPLFLRFNLNYLVPPIFSPPHSAFIQEAHCIFNSSSNDTFHKEHLAQRRNTMKNLMIPTVLVSLTLSMPSMAKGPHHDKADWAKVTHVEPITRTVEHSTPHKTCWNERVHYNQPRHQNDSYTGTIMGGIIGGAIGNAVGHGKKNKQVGAVVGSILGASVGHEISSKNRYQSGSYSTYHDKKRCSFEERIRYEEEVVGYHVSYRYRGDVYQTRMNQHPGKRIKVRVSVEPY